MFHPMQDNSPLNRRVRAILLTEDNRLMFIKRIKSQKTAPYWVAPGGGVEDEDSSVLDALHRELYEELGAKVDVVKEGFVLRHRKADKNLEESFYICRLLDYDLSQRHGPEFDDPSRGQYIPDAIELKKEAIESINIKTDELRVWLIDNLQALRTL